MVGRLKFFDAAKATVKANLSADVVVSIYRSGDIVLAAPMRLATVTGEIPVCAVSRLRFIWIYTTSLRPSKVYLCDTGYFL